MTADLHSIGAVLRRRAWVLPVAMIGVTVVLTLLGTFKGSTKSAAETVVLVTPGAKLNNPGQAQQAVQLAATYATAIPQDDGVLRSVGRVVGRDPDGVAERLSATVTQDTSLITLRYTDEGDARAMAGAKVLATTITGDAPEAVGVDARVLRILRQPRLVDDSSNSGGEVIAVGLFLGLCLGAIIILAWERSDRRVDRPDQLSDEIGCPATQLNEMTAVNMQPILDRWLELSPHDPGSGAIIGVLAGSGQSERFMTVLTASLERLSTDSTYEVAVGRSDNSRHRDSITLVPGPVPGSRAAGETVARGSDIVVLAVVRGTKSADLQMTLRVLAEFGTKPAWGLLFHEQDLRGVKEGRSLAQPARV